MIVLRCAFLLVLFDLGSWPYILYSPDCPRMWCAAYLPQTCGSPPASGLPRAELKEYGTVASKEDDLDVLAHLCDALL